MFNFKLLTKNKLTRVIFSSSNKNILMDRISEPKRENVCLFNSLDVAKILMLEQKLRDSTW